MDHEGIGSLFLEFLVEKAGIEARDNEKSSLQQELMREIYGSSETDFEKKRLPPSVSETRREDFHKALLAKLHYTGMEDRESRVVEAHESTFQWIFEDRRESQRPWSSFKDWLISDSQLYWITGKAGSGKSTLMKYVCRVKGNDQDQLLKKLLRKWAKTGKLVVPAFFFWNSGIALQMSQAGLLRTLLAQILEEAPELLPVICPDRWEALCLFNEDNKEWTDHELRDMMRSIAMNLEDDMKLCLFVDGLDEFEGDHKELVTLFRDLLASPAIKLCVSSRPWVVFEDAFRQEPSLMLQDLTYPDIKHYVASHFYKDTGFSLLRQREPSYAEELVENVVIKSSGVFLWVRLVVQSLLSGVGHGDRVSDLERRLDSLPPDLEDLYNKILSSLDPFYLEHAAQYFKLVEKSPEPPGVLFLAYADEAEEFQKIIDLQVRESTNAEVEMLFETMRRRLNSRCKGFLEVPALQQSILDDREVLNMRKSTVQYLHRTVKDYVNSPAVRQKLQSAMVKPFDHNFSFCIGNLALLKTMSPKTLCFRAEDVFWTYVTRFMQSSAKLCPIYRRHLQALMDNFDASCSTLAKQSAECRAPRFLEYDDQTRGLLEAGQWVGLHPITNLSQHFGGHFLSLAVCYAINEYVEAKVNKSCLVQRATKSLPSFISTASDRNTEEIKSNIGFSGIHPLLLDAICFSKKTTRLAVLTAYGIVQPDISILQCLLRKGADPNARFRASDEVGTVWEFAKTACMNDLFVMKPLRSGALKDAEREPRTLIDQELLEKWTAIYALMIQYGAGEFSAKRRKAILERLQPSRKPQTDIADVWHYLCIEVLKLGTWVKPQEVAVTRESGSWVLSYSDTYSSRVRGLPFWLEPILPGNKVAFRFGWQ